MDTLFSCNASTFPRDPLRSSRRLKMSYRLTAVRCPPSATVDSWQSYRDTREDPREGGIWPRHSPPRPVKHVQQLPHSPIPFAHSSISFGRRVVSSKRKRERDHILILRPENVETIWTFLSGGAADGTGALRRASIKYVTSEFRL